MNLVIAPGVLLKIAPAAGVRALGVAGNTVPIRELCPNEPPGGPDRAAAARPRWYIADFGASVSPPDAWDVAYEAARAHGGYAEPDVGRQWEYRNPIRLQLGAAPGDLCAYNDQSPDFPRGPGFAWHLDASGLRAARREIEQLPHRASVRIGILDTGFDPQHNARPESILEKLQRNFTHDGRREDDASDPYDRGPFTSPGHGTGTIGLLAGRRLQNMARPEQNGDYLGGAPLAGILPVRIAAGVVLLFTSAFAEGLDYLIAPQGVVADRVDVVSMSMGGVASRAWADVVNRAYDAGIVMVTAAGNNFPLTPQSIVYPARFRRVIAACGAMADGRPYIRKYVPAGAMAGNYGPQSKMDDSALAAYTPNSAWAEINCSAIVDMDGSGTSSATPQIAAAAALWLQKHKDSVAAWQGWEKVEAVRNALFQSASTSSPDFATYFGKGILRADQALAVAPAQGLKPRPVDSACLGFWKVVLGQGIAAPDPIRSEMLGVEAAQLFQIDPEVAATMADPDIAESAPPEFFDAVIGSPYASKTLKNAMRDVYPSAAVPGADLGRPAPPERPRNQVVSTTKPVSRRLRVYAIDPSLSTALDTAAMNEAVVSVPWEELAPGPAGEYIEVVDADPATGCFYAPVDLDEPELLASDGLAPNAGDPRFHQQMVYAVAMRTIRNFETALGRLALWSPLMTPGNPDDSHYIGQLRIYPHALRENNAYYNPDKKALLFGYFPARQAQPGELYPNGITFTCLSHDIVAHETTHALLDGMHRNFNLDGSGDALAFHEAFADLVALLQHFSLPQVLEYAIGRTRGDLRIDNLLAQIGQEFGIASGMHKALRSALGRKPDATAIDKTTEPHGRGAILVAAVFDAFVAMYTRRSSDLLRLASEGSGLLRPGAIHPDLVGRLAEEARQTAQHVLSMCIRALDYCSVDITFGEYLRAIITADFDLVPECVLDYRVAFVEAFRSWGLYPSDLQTLSPQSLKWRGLQFRESQAILSRILGIAREFADKSRYLAWSTDPRFEGMSTRQRIFTFSREWREKLHDALAAEIPKLSADQRAKLGLDLGLDLSTGRERFEVHALRLSEKNGPDNEMQCDLILQVLQHRDEMSAAGPFRFIGGSTVIADERSLQVKYSIPKNIGNAARLARMRDSIEGSPTLRQLYFGGTPFTGSGERFAVVHRMGEEF